MPHARVCCRTPWNLNRDGFPERQVVENSLIGVQVSKIRQLCREVSRMIFQLLFDILQLQRWAYLSMSLWPLSWPSLRVPILISPESWKPSWFWESLSSCDGPSWLLSRSGLLSLELDIWEIKKGHDFRWMVRYMYAVREKYIKWKTKGMKERRKKGGK